MPITDLTMELQDGTSTHPAHARCVVLDYSSQAMSAPRFKPPCQGFASKVLTIEHLVTLDRLPVPRFEVVGLPLRIKGATGSPIRAVAIIPDKGASA
jgi:kynurenine formamidase